MRAPICLSVLAVLVFAAVTVHAAPDDLEGPPRAEPEAGSLPTLPETTPAHEASPLGAFNPPAAEAPQHTQRCDYVGPRNTVATQPLALAARGVGFSYERLVGPPTFSVAALVGGRSAALGDYSSATVSGGVEARAWARIVNRNKCGSMAMNGLYLGLRLDAAYTRVSDRTTDRFAGSSVALESMVTLGWRFVIWRTVEVTPSIAGGLRSDIDPRAGLGTSARPAGAIGLEVGWMF
jgi:hypothetical protein